MAQHPTDMRMNVDRLCGVVWLVDLGTSLFEEYDEEARLSAAKELEKASKEMEVAAQKRRNEVAKLSNGRGKHPKLYNTYGLPKTITNAYPDCVYTEEHRVQNFEAFRGRYKTTVITYIANLKTSPA